jgi:hypothetical protein
LSYTVHIAVASFIAAAHTTMLKWLKAAEGQNVGDLHRYWYERMESGDRSYRNAFFLEVTNLASAASRLCFCFGFCLKFLTVETSTQKL